MSEQAFINGFLKRAADYGVSEAEAVELLKQSAAPRIVPKGRIPFVSKLIGERRVSGHKNVKGSGKRNSEGKMVYPDSNLYNRPSDKTIVTGTGAAAAVGAGVVGKKMHDKSKEKSKE